MGVVDLPYTAEESATTTGQVAQWLENRYHPMQIYYELNQDRIADDLSESVASALENSLMGAPAGADIYAGATTKIEAGFKEFLSLDVMASLGYPGVPTAAALAGVNHRLKRKKGPPRISFVDTGSYMAAFHAWID